MILQGFVPAWKPGKPKIVWDRGSWRCDQEELNGVGWGETPSIAYRKWQQARQQVELWSYNDRRRT